MWPKNCIDAHTKFFLFLIALQSKSLKSKLLWISETHCMFIFWTVCFQTHDWLECFWNSIFLFGFHTSFVSENWTLKNLYLRHLLKSHFRITLHLLLDRLWTLTLAEWLLLIRDSFFLHLVRELDYPEFSNKIQKICRLLCL